MFQMPIVDLIAGYVRKRTEKPAGEAEDGNRFYSSCEGEWTCGTY